MPVGLARPTPELVKSRIYEFDQHPSHDWADRTVAAVFEQAPGNVEPEHVLAKVAVLNSLYNTVIYDVVPVANRILQVNPDERLVAGDLTLVEEIAQVATAEGKAFSCAYCGTHVYPSLARFSRSRKPH